jgi:hypothetical protein
MRKGASAADPLELRPGAADRFYLVWADWLADGDVVQASAWQAPAAVVLSAELINPDNLTLGGATFTPGTVTSVQLSGVDLGDLVELENTISTASGRTEKQSLWVRGVKNYAA